MSVSSNILYKAVIKPHKYRKMALIAVSSFFKLFGKRHDIKIFNLQKLLDAVNRREMYRPLITVVNHTSMVDDTLLWTQSLPLSTLINPKKMRWTLTASDVCFTSKGWSDFFMAGQCIPVSRNIQCKETGQLLSIGGGVKQPSMDFAKDILNEGGWLNVFPQGKIIYDADKIREGDLRLRWGIGRLINECNKNPIILPIWHCGMDTISPCVAPYGWSTLKSMFNRKKATIYVGDAITLLSIPKDYDNPEAAWTYITSLIQNQLYEVRKKAIQFHKTFLMES